MTVKELIEQLVRFKPDIEVMILDSFNGGGYPRSINFGPIKNTITEDMANATADCEDRVGNDVIVLGFGCY